MILARFCFGAVSALSICVHGSVSTLIHSPTKSLRGRNSALVATGTGPRLDSRGPVGSQAHGTGSVPASAPSKVFLKSSSGSSVTAEPDLKKQIDDVDKRIKELNTQIMDAQAHLSDIKHESQSEITKFERTRDKLDRQIHDLEVRKRSGEAHLAEGATLTAKQIYSELHERDSAIDGLYDDVQFLHSEVSGLHTEDGYLHDDIAFNFAEIKRYFEASHSSGGRSEEDLKNELEEKTGLMQDLEHHADLQEEMIANEEMKMEEETQKMKKILEEKSERIKALKSEVASAGKKSNHDETESKDKQADVAETDSQGGCDDWLNPDCYG
jgi:uncharacterized protein YlxW (UPF0749 family)